MDYYKTNFNTAKEASLKTVALEDSIMKKGSPAAGGSKILEGFIPPFDATAVERLSGAGFEIAGITKMKEFGIPDLFSEQRSLVSAPVQAVLNGAPYCLCNDLFGCYRKEAAENGLCYIHPTYGTVSRYGLIPLASSMDQIGIICKDLEKGFNLLSVIAGYDSKDGAMFSEKEYVYKPSEKTVKVCVPKNITAKADAKTRMAIDDLAGKFSAIAVDFDFFDAFKQTFFILASAEISNNINRYDGIKFGYRHPDTKNLESLYLKTRTEGFGFGTKLMSIMGMFVLSSGQYVKYYEKAMKIRRLIKNSLAFDKYDVIILPSSISNFPYENLSLYSIAQIAGLCSISFCYKGCGIQMIAAPKNENALYSAWETVKREKTFIGT